MSRFSIGPHTVQAVQFRSLDTEWAWQFLGPEDRDWTRAAVEDGAVHVWHDDPLGEMLCQVGDFPPIRDFDWVVRDADGRLVPCTNDVFENNYDPVR